jgi:2-polyprenyl-3-methyl-5-hydroxy-6-metoxy-1,4-benzoquinol methylase
MPMQKLFTFLQNYLLSIKEYLSEHSRMISIFLFEQKDKITNILDTNLKLGQEHLFNGRIDDAIIRFRIATTILDPRNLELNYWLGVAYFFKGNIVNAIAYLEDSKDIGKDFLEFVQNINHADEIPHNFIKMIHQVHSSINYHKYYTFLDREKKPVSILMEFVAYVIDNLKSTENEIKILDYAASHGLIAKTIDYMMKQEYSITGIDILESNIEYLETLNSDSRKLYSDLILGGLEEIKGTYDIISCVDFMDRTNLEEYLTSFRAHLNDNGLLCIILRTNNTTRWIPNETRFGFEKEYILKQLSLAEFDILDIKEWNLEKEQQFFIGLICNKKGNKRV